MHTNPFATEAAQYAHLRPTYPESVFAFLSKTVASGDVAWDCATGNGQAATHLARYFGRVVATDESAEMIGQAPALDVRGASVDRTDITTTDGTPPNPKYIPRSMLVHSRLDISR